MIREKDRGKLIDYLQGLNLLATGAVEELKKDDALITECISEFESKSGLTSIGVVIRRDIKAEFSIDDYSIKLMKLPAVDHIFSMDTDTKELEDRLSGIDWGRDFYLVQDFDSPVSITFKDLLRLRLFGDQETKDVADMLIIKYWMQTPIMALIPPGIDFGKYTRELTVPLNGNSTDLSALQAICLLEGRSVKRFDDTAKSTELAGDWVVAENGRLKVLPDFDLSEMIKALPFATTPDILDQTYLYFELAEGKRQSVNLKVKGKEQTVLIDVDAKAQQLSHYSATGQRLDPELFKQPEQKVTGKKEKPTIKTAPTKRRKPRKGKGL